ncbi:MAG: hypothetical protein ACO1QB_12820 [Verrucomicrobiales bacterium]
MDLTKAAPQGEKTVHNLNFPQTRWTWVKQAGEGATDSAHAALEEICRMYDKPLLRYAEIKGLGQRAEDLKQQFFLNLIPCSPFLSEDDFSKFAAFVAKLQKGSDPVSSYLKQRLTQDALDELASYNETKSTTEAFRTLLAGEINKIIEGPSIYKSERFAEVEIGMETEMLLKLQPTGDGLLRLNRLLLQDAFPDEIEKLPTLLLQRFRRMPGKRFRSFLLTCFQHFVRDHSMKRANSFHDSLGHFETAEEESKWEPGDDSKAVKEYERTWARGMLEHVALQLQAEYAAARKANLFNELQVYIYQKQTEETYQELGQRINKSEGAIKQEVRRMRNRFKELLQETIAPTVTWNFSPAEIENLDELKRQVFEDNEGADFLRRQLRMQTVELLQQHNERSARKESLAALLSEDLNKLIEGEMLTEQTCFATTAAKHPLPDILKSGSGKVIPQRVNRLVIENSFTGLAKNKEIEKEIASMLELFSS